MNKGIKTVGLLLCTILTLAEMSCKHSASADKYAGMDTTLVRLYKQLEKHPKNAKLHMDIADYYMKHLLLDSALNHALASIRIDSNNAKHYVKLSDLYLSMKETDLCEDMLNKALRIDSKNNEAYLKLAELHFLFRRYDEAADVIAKTISLKDFNPKAHFIQGWIFREKGDTASAIRSYMKAVDQNSKYFEAYEELAHLYHTRHQTMAIDYYKNALRIKPDDIQTHYNLAMFYQETGDNERAISQYQQILQTEPDNRFALHNIGWIYLSRMEKFNEAIQFFTKAIDQDSTYLEAIYNRGLAFECIGNFQSARQDFAYSLHLDATYEPSIEALNRLDKKEIKKR